MPEIVTPESRYFTAEEALAIITAANEPYRTFYWVTAETGIRLGEACALRPSDFNLPMRAVIIRWNSIRGDVGSTKSKRPRAFAISSQLADHLREFMAGKAADEFLFARTHGKNKGKPWAGDYIIAQHLQPLLKQLGIAPAGMHAFRHCNATLLDREHIPMKVRQERLGHSNAEVLTIGIYSHANSKDHRRAADKIGKILCPNVPKHEEPLKDIKTNGRVM